MKENCLKYKIYVHYKKEGKPISDFKVKEYVYKIIEKTKNYKEEFSWTTLFIHAQISNYITVNAFQLAVAQGKIPHENIVFKFEDNEEEIGINKYGELDKHPIDKELDMLKDLFEARKKIYEKEKKEKEELKRQTEMKLIPRCCRDCFKFDSDECSKSNIMCIVSPVIICCGACRKAICIDFVHEPITD